MSNFFSKGFNSEEAWQVAMCGAQQALFELLPKGFVANFAGPSIEILDPQGNMVSKVDFSIDEDWGNDREPMSSYAVQSGKSKEW
jgi:hypothetical protein